MSVVDSRDACRLLQEVHIENESSVMLLRARVHSAVRRLELPQVLQENAALTAIELATNILKFANSQGFVQIWQQPDKTLDIFALDYGPGIADLALACQDGYSSVGTMGKGLGSVLRLSGEADIYTCCASERRVQGWCGVAIFARFRPDQETRPWAAPLRVGLFSRSLGDERFNGDVVYLQRTGQALRWLHLDGLGHGRIAQETTAGLDDLLTEKEAPLELIQTTHERLKHTRGAVGVAGEVRFLENKMILAGVGDMHAHILREGSDDAERLFFPPGVLGRGQLQPAERRDWFERSGLLVTASDGIRRNWDSASFPGLFSHHPQLIAYLIGNIMGRLADDRSLCIVSL